VVFPVFWDLASVIPKEHLRALSWTLPAGSVRRDGLRRINSALAEIRSGTLDRSRACLLVALGRGLMRQVVENAMVVCPNSVAEMGHLASYLGVAADKRWLVVRNGIWPSEIPDALPWERRRREILCVGGLSPRKNSLTLVRAAAESGLPLRIVGVNMAQPDAYGRKVARIATSTTRFEPPRAYSEVLGLLATTRAHAQVGFVETPGLATLEALAAGASAVVASTPVVLEYLPKGVCTVDPSSVRSVALGLRTALDEPPAGGMAEHVKATYDWDIVLRPLAHALGLAS
jgi:glycosyltransferase involved in cell wall biosynthesis